MTAALHLAHVHQPPPTTARKRKRGGGGGDGYDRLVARVYQDKRMTPGSRELILLLAWLVARDPNQYATDGTLINPWKRAADILGEYGTGRRKESRLADLIDADRPRYEPDRSADIWRDRVCAAPMIRRQGECGQPAVDYSRIVDAATGWHTPAWYCRRHEAWGEELDAAWRVSERVEPIPNRGGLMPSYLQADKGDASWVSVYRRASEWKLSRWKPPVRYGLRADDWPIPGREPAPEPVRLRLAASDGHLIAPAPR